MFFNEINKMIIINESKLIKLFQFDNFLYQINKFFNIKSGK